MEVNPRKAPQLKVVKTAARRYKVIGHDEDGNEIRQSVAPAEYAIRRGDVTVGVIVKMGEGWRCCLPSETSRIGLAVSPIGLDAWGKVKVWALRELANEGL